MCRRPPWGCLQGPQPSRPGATAAHQLAVAGEMSDRLPGSFRHQVQEGVRRGEVELPPQAGAMETPASAVSCSRQSSGTGHSELQSWKRSTGGLRLSMGGRGAGGERPLRWSLGTVCLGVARGGQKGLVF